MSAPAITIRLEHFLARLTEWVPQRTVEANFSEIFGLYSHGYSVAEVGAYLAEASRQGRRT